MVNDLRVGAKWRKRIHVDKPRTISFMGEQLRVYSTPSMVLDVEDACKDFLQEHLGSEDSSVGARVEIDHLGPTLIEMWVDIDVVVTTVDGRKVSFDAEVRDPVELVGRAKHTRVIVNLAKQAARLNGKAAKLAQGPGGIG